MTEVIPWLLFCFVCYCIGYYRGVRTRRNKEPRIYSVEVSKVQTVYLRELGKIPADKAEWLARQVTSGVKFRGLYLERRYGGQLTHAEFNAVRDDLINRHMAYKKGNVTDLLPAGLAAMRFIANRCKQASA